ncbi:hypothetical protein BDZ89DRAFT_423331 [Hymenopellis radicata]|nr:hypothetical protein BDZ89DRAFT_423331 [Hymenopellis radicata]
MMNMRPSFIRWVLDVCFPQVKTMSRPRSATYMHHLPDDILLVLTLLQTRSVQLTSLRNERPLVQDTSSSFEAASSSSDDGSSVSETSSTEDSAESVSVIEETSLFQNVLGAVMAYALNNGDCKKHTHIDRAAISALQAVVNSDAFGTGTVIALNYEAAVVEILFKALNRRLEFSGLNDRDSAWLTPSLFQRIWHVLSAFIESGAVRNGWRAVGYVLNYVLQFPSQLQAAEAIYGYLVQQDWLHDIGLAFSRLLNSTDPESDRLPRFWCPGYIFVAAAYVDGIYMYADTSELIGKAKSHIAESDARLSTLSKILLIAHCPRKIGCGDWERCSKAAAGQVAWKT